MTYGEEALTNRFFLLRGVLRDPKVGSVLLGDVRSLKCSNPEYGWLQATSSYLVLGTDLGDGGSK